MTKGEPMIYQTLQKKTNNREPPNPCETKTNKERKGTGMHSGALESKAVPVPLVAPVALLV